MISNIPDWTTHGLTAILGGVATFFGFKKMLAESSVSDNTTKAHLEIIEYLKQVKDSALEAEAKAKEIAISLEEENKNLRIKIEDLEKTNDSIKVHNKILTDIVSSLQHALQQTKLILEEQISINDELLTRLQEIESSPEHPQ